MGVPDHFRSWKEIYAKSFLINVPVPKLGLSTNPCLNWGRRFRSGARI